MDGYLLFTYILLKYFTQINGKVCISWSLYSDQLKIACKADNIVFSVSIYNPSGDEVAHCLLPYPKPTCHSNVKMSAITQDITSGETVFVVPRNRNDHLLNGIWSCVHGSQNENARVEVVVPRSLGNEVPPTISLSGPKYVKTKQKIPLLCTSNTDPTDSAVSFEVYNKFNTTIYKNTSGCFTGLKASTCPSDVCQCFSDGRSFILQYHAELDNGVLSFRCFMNFKNFGYLSDCFFVTVVDITGPFISFDTQSPLSAGSVVEITCKTISSDYRIELTMHCLQTVVRTNESDNKNAYEVKIAKPVTSSDNGTMCTCKASSVVTTSFSTSMQIIRAPILDTLEQIYCNHTDSVLLSCRVSGEMTELGFMPWEHQFHGTYIRSVPGNITGNVSILSINSCSYEDTGEYICKAWNQDSLRIFYQQSSTNLTIIGPPIVVDKMITMGTTLTLSAKFLSLQRPHNPKWYYENQLLPKSAHFYQNTSKVVIVIRMYGKVLTHDGYIANLTVTNEDYRIFDYMLLLRNDYGTAKLKFEITNGSNVFNIRLFGWISLAVFLVLVAIFVSTVLIYLHKRNSQRLVASRSIYFAAPGQINNLNIYNETTSLYEEIDDDYVVPEISGSDEESVKDDTEDNQEENIGHYLDLE